jgi:hypothetical protein
MGTGEVGNHSARNPAEALRILPLDFPAISLRGEPLALNFTPIVSAAQQLLQRIMFAMPDSDCALSCLFEWGCRG